MKTKKTKLCKCIAVWEKAYSSGNFCSRIVLYGDESGYVEINHEAEFYFNSLRELYAETFRRWPIEEEE